MYNVILYMHMHAHNMHVYTEKGLSPFSSVTHPSPQMFTFFPENSYVLGCLFCSVFSLCHAVALIFPISALPHRVKNGVAPCHPDSGAGSRGTLALVGTLTLLRIGHR